MKKKLLLIFILAASFLNAQEVSETDVIKIIEKDFAGLPQSQLERLVPYTDKNSLTGFIDFETRKIIVKAKYFELDFFKPNLKGNYNGTYLFEYDPVTKKTAIHLDSEMGITEERNPGIQKNPKAIAMNGFSLTEDKKLKNFSDSYSYFSEDLFFYNNKYYGIAIKDKKRGIVDEEGKPLAGFDFNYDGLELNTYYTGTDIWFKFLKSDDTSGFINQKGEMKFVNEFEANYSSKDWTSIYCANASENFLYNGYEILHTKEGTAGLLDLEQMKWVIKSDKKREVVELNYASSKKIDNIKKEKKDIKLYILMYDKKLERKYYISDTFVEYKPFN